MSPAVALRLLPLPALLLVLCLGACRSEDTLPDPSSQAYRDAVTAFYTGVAAVQVGENRRAEDRLVEVTRLAPQEPAAWADLGLLALRQNEFDLAAERLDRARALAPENAQIQLLSAVLESVQGRADEARVYLRRAIELDPGNLKAIFELARLIEQEEGARGAEEVGRLLDTLLTAQPNNLAVLLERARLAAQRDDVAALQQIVARIEAQSASWPPDVLEQFQALKEASEASDARLAASRVAFLTNVLKQLPSYRSALAAVQTPVEQGGDLITRFLRLPAPPPNPAPPDDSLSFTAEPLTGDADAEAWTWIQALALSDEAPPAVVTANGRTVQIERGDALPFPGGPAAVSPSPRSIAGLDFNYDFRMDLVFAGAGGVRLFEQTGAGDFAEVTARMALPPAVTEAAYSGVWAADLDLEGDIDLVLAPPAGPPRILRNNGDGTFTQWPLFQDVEALRAFAWADLDNDGDPDAALLDAAGRLYVFFNERARRFQAGDLPSQTDAFLALEPADVNSDGLIDLVLLRTDGAILRLSDQAEGGWNMTEVARWTDLPAAAEPGATQLFTADLDNNGGADLVGAAQSAGRVWLSTTPGVFEPLTDVAGRIFGASDLLGEGRLDLVGLSTEGRPVRLVGRGTRAYQSTSVRPRAAEALGDQRINSFGIGGEIEMRSGLLFQKQPITGPVVHFGLGENLVADVVRIIWPNGDVQAEFDVLSDQTVLTRQRLKGSCPWLFTYDGEGMQFVTDFLWRSPLGLAINAQETAGVMMTEDRVKIRGDQLAERDGFYDVRITAELWETHFFDHVSLMVVDHPDGTEVFLDERFAFPPPDLAVHAVTPPRPVARALDDRGRDVTGVVRARDERYLGGFDLGAYQGVAQDHYVEVDLGDDAPADGPLLLVAAGWVRPTDSSINVALSQGSAAPPVGLRLEVPDGDGGWITARDNLGFPAGKEKTILIDLDGVFRPGAPRRLRLRTNLEIYWDALAWATPLPDAELRTQRLPAETADLRYRGFSEVTEADRTSPELPHYDELKGTAQVWRDLIGYYTRFGDVRELVRDVDDRYVIMNAGDELAFRFPAPPPPPDGWRRDFVLVGDGWVKDGDFNTTFSKTVLPLPRHDAPRYDTPPGRLEDDPVYRRHAQDWQTYHTRYVTPDFFRDALRLPDASGR